MDIVFVVDDSGSMAEEQSNLATNFPMFANLLAQYTTQSGEKLDYRVAITTTGRPENYTVVIPGVGSLPQMETGPTASSWPTAARPRRGSRPRMARPATP